MILITTAVVLSQPKWESLQRNALCTSQEHFLSNANKKHDFSQRSTILCLNVDETSQKDPLLHSSVNYQKRKEQ